MIGCCYYDYDSAWCGGYYENSDCWIGDVDAGDDVGGDEWCNSQVSSDVCWISDAGCTYDDAAGCIWNGERFIMPLDWIVESVKGSLIAEYEAWYLYGENCYYDGGCMMYEGWAYSCEADCSVGDVDYGDEYYDDMMDDMDMPDTEEAEIDCDMVNTFVNA